MCDPNSLRHIPQPWPNPPRSLPAAPGSHRSMPGSLFRARGPPLIQASASLCMGPSQSLFSTCPRTRGSPLAPVSPSVIEAHEIASCPNTPGLFSLLSPLVLLQASKPPLLSVHLLPPSPSPRQTWPLQVPPHPSQPFTGWEPSCPQNY